MGFARDTIVALATPAGTSAIALVRLSGPETRRLAGELAGKLPNARRVRRTDYRNRRGAVLDDVLLTFFPGPESYTGEDVLEISCHGNPFIVQCVLEDLLARGGRAAEAGEFSQRAFLNGRMDLSQAEAVMDLIHARSEKALEAANQQLRGALGRHMQAVIEQLVGVLAQIEAYIDFPDEDLPPEDHAGVVSRVHRVNDAVGNLLATNHYGDILRDGIKTVILGEPNVGKSSLLNHLVGFDRALVSPEPGTTRDYLEECIPLGGYYLRLIDTAGLNSSPAPLEKLGMNKTLERLNEADLVLLVSDATRPAPLPAPEIAAALALKRTVNLRNKVDLIGTNHDTQATGEKDVIHVSALTGQGFDQLRSTLLQLAEAFHVEQSGDLIAINARHADALDRAKSALTRAEALLHEHAAMELLAGELREALDACGEISGKVDNEQILNHLFAQFCIGK